MDDTILGFGFAIVSFLFFGLCLIPTKFRSVQAAKLDPFIFNMYMTSGVCIGSLLLLIYYQSYVFTPMAIIAGTLWSAANASACLAIRFIGLSLGSGIWSGLSMLVSFLWGALYFQDPLNLPVGVSALLAMIIGVLILSIAGALPTFGRIPALDPFYRFFHMISPAPAADQHTFAPIPMVELSHRPIAEENQPGPDAPASSVAASNPEGNAAADAAPLASNLSEHKDDPESQGGRENQADHEEHANDDDDHDDDHMDDVGLHHQVPDLHEPIHNNMTSKSMLIGLLLCCFLALTNGSMFVPTRYTKDDAKETFLVTFGPTAFVCGIIIGFAKPLFQRKMPEFHFRETYWAGLLSGLIWTVGNTCAFYATEMLGFAIGFPLTQLGLVVAGIISIFIYKEITDRVAIALWSLGVFIVCGGAFLLGYSSQT